MAPRTQTPTRAKPTLPPQLAAATLHAAGIAIGAEAPAVALPPSDAPPPGRCGAASPADLDALADWGAPCQGPTVARASTGVAWLPLCALLEARGVEGRLVDPQQVQQRKGRPTRDVPDCPWLQRLHPVGVRASALRPGDQLCVLRSDLRQRAMLLTYAGPHIQQRHKALTQRHRKGPHVVSASTGGTGCAILRALLAGERDAGTRAPLRDSRGTHAEATLARA